MSGNQIHVFWEAAGHKGTDGPNRVGAHKRPKRSHPTKMKSAHYFYVVLVKDSSLNATFGVYTCSTWGPPQGVGTMSLALSPSCIKLINKHHFFPFFSVCIHKSLLAHLSSELRAPTSCVKVINNLHQKFNFNFILVLYVLKKYLLEIIFLNRF